MSVQRLTLIVLLALRPVPCYGQAAVGGDGAARPLKRFASAAGRGGAVAISGFEFLRPYLGYEGPNLTRLEGEPSAGARYLVTARLYPQGAVGTARFELVDEGGRPIRVLRMSKLGNSLDDGEYVGLAEVPGRPFRVAVGGERVDGTPYRHVFERLFRPSQRPPAPPLLPGGLTPQEAEKVSASLKAIEKQALDRAEREAAKHPDGVIVMPRVEVSNATYEPLLSGKGEPLGMRLRYDLRFSSDGDYAHSLHVFPFYDEVDLRGLVSMQVIGETVEPKPAPPSYAAPQIHIDMDALVKYGSEARFKAGTVYRFTVDLVPDFVGQNATKTKFCVDEEQFKSSAVRRWAWRALKARPAPVRYRVFLNQLNDGGETEPFHPPATFFNGFLRDGAVRCKPHRNIYF